MPQLNDLSKSQHVGAAQRHIFSFGGGACRAPHSLRRKICAVSGILSSGMPIDPEDLGNGIGCLACRDSLGDLLL